MASSSQSNNNDAQHYSSSHPYIITVLVALACIVLFFRSILPRLSRLFLGGRLRIKRVGLRGIWGLEWRSKGFSKPRINHQSERGTFAEGDRDSQGKISADGLIVQIKRIYPIIRIRNIDTTDSSKATQSGYPVKTTWITIRVEGVGLTVPQSSDKENDEGKGEKAKKEEDALAKVEEELKRQQDEENARLEYLMQSRPSSPLLGGGGSITPTSPSSSSSPMPAFATAMSQASSSTAQNTSEPQSLQDIPSRDIPSDIILYTRKVILPMIWFIVLKTLRALLYLVISALPFLTSIVDVQLTQIEVYSLEAEAVIRVEKVSLGLDMSFITSPDQARKTKKESTSKCWTETLYSMSNQIKNGAKDAAFFVTDGLPAGRVSLRLSTTGLQIIEATIARRAFSSDNHSITQQGHFQSQPTLSSSTYTTSTRSLHRSNSFAGVSSFTSTDAGASEWSSWSSEGLNSHFPPYTSWLKGREGSLDKLIHSSARVLCMPGTNSLQLGLLLNGFSSISSKESIHIGVHLCQTTVGVDGLIKVFRTLEARKAVRSGFAPTEDGEKGTRSQLSKHFKQQKPQAQAKFLEKLGSVSFTWPSISLIMSSKIPLSALAPKDELPHHEQSILPSSIQMLAEVKDISLSIQTSNPADELHQKWLGTCGIKGHGKNKNAKAFADRFRWNQSKPKEHVEHRRAFHIEGKVNNINIRVGIDGEAKKLRSELLELGDIQMRTRSTWTPFGLLSSCKESSSDPQAFFQGDPNEQAVILEFSLGKLVGDLQYRHAVALLAFAQIKKAERMAKRKELGLKEKVPERPDGYLNSLPKFSMGVKLNDLSYRMVASTSDENHSQKPDLSLVMAVPDVNFVLHASYVDQYVRRSEHERKAAWKSLQSDQLEWTLKEDTDKKRECTSEEGRTVPRQLGGEYKTWLEEKDKQSESDPERVEKEKKPAEPMTMLEALKKMKELQAAEEFKGQVNKDRAFRAVNKWKKVTHKKTQANNGGVAFNIRYVFDSQCTISSVEVFWVMKGGQTSTRRKTYDVQRITTAEARLSPGLTKFHVLGLNFFEANTTGHLPGYQNIVSDAVKLETNKLVQDVRASLEDVDVDMWHPSALDATRQLAGILIQAKQSIPSSLLFDEEVEEKEAQKAEKEETRIDFIEALQAGTSAYVSIGSIVAHVGGVDERCDHSLSRGVGFEGKRLVVELACSDTISKRQSDALRSGLGARSALELLEDLTSSCNALATRHGKAAMAKISLFEFGLFPILDGEQASNQHLQRNDSKKSEKDGESNGVETVVSPSIFAPAIWDFHHTRPQKTSGKQKHAKHRQQDRSNFIFWMPFSSTKFSLIPKEAKSNKIGKKLEELTITTEGTRLLSFKIELLHTYCILMAYASLKSLIPEKKPSSAQKAKEEADQHDKTKVNNEDRVDKKVNRKTKKPSRFNHLTHSAMIKVDEIHISIALPDEVNVFCHIRRLECSDGATSIPQVGFEALMAAVQSPKFETNGGLWEEAVRMRDVRVTFEPKTDAMPIKINVNADGTNIKVPFDYQVHPLIDGTVVSVKATKQLLHQFIKGGTDSVITPVPEGPKHLPIIKVKIRAIAFAGDDDPFETRLNIIWRAGGDENQARSERDAAFKEKARQMEYKAASAASVSVQSASASMTDISTASSETSPDESVTAEDEKQKSSEVKVTLEQAREALDAFNGSSWIRRFANSKAEQGRREDASMKAVYGRLPMDHHLKLPIQLAPRQRSAPLFRSTWTDFVMEVGPTSFPESQLRDFLHEQGNGMPKDMEYSLMVPMHLRISCSEWKISLRDYPLPMFHVPPINTETQPRDLEGFIMEADVCIAEQMSDSSAIRHIPAIIVPASTGRADAIEYGISIPRMAMPTKMFGSPIIKINSAYPTRLVWGQSIQPAIHDVTRVIEGITSPPHDPSPRIGFWDKLSLILHGRVHFQFPGDGELHIYLKGSRDPYHILEHGAGWVKCWRGDVEIKINFENEQREVFQIMSQEYLLAIPDLKDYIDRAATGTGDGNHRNFHHHQANHSRDRTSSLHSASSQESSYRGYKRRPDFKKVCLKLTNGVRWGAGLLLERTCTDDTCLQETTCRGIPFHRECRIWERKKHWEVYQRSKDYAKTLPEGKFGDSYKGWRSHHLHFSLSIYSFKNGPVKTEDESKKSPGELTNNLYFSPLAWEHFWAWMRLFNSALSLPIREGKLFPGSLDQQSPKFGRNLGTIKYRFDISPMFITHVYTQDAKSDWAKGFTTMLGVKARMGVFHFDLHQRQQEMLKYRPELGESRTIFHKPFYEAEVDLGDIDLRTLAAQFVEPEKQLYSHEEDDDDSQQNQFDVIFGTDQECKISDRDLYWHDISDFVELDWAPAVDGKAPKIRLMQALTCPRFNYYRRIESQRERKARADHQHDESKEDNGSDTTVEDKDDEQSEGSLSRLEKSKFGKEHTHSCLVGEAPAIGEVQMDLARERIKFLNEELEKLKGEQERNASSAAAGKIVKATAASSHAHFSGEDTQSAAAKADDFKRKIKMIEEYLKMLDRLNHSSVFQSNTQNEATLKDDIGRAAYDYLKSGTHSFDNLQAIFREWEAYDNRYFVHNPSVFYSNATRDVLLKYYISSRKRRGIVHSLSAKAVRYIRDLGKPEDDLGHSNASTKRKNSRAKDADVASIKSKKEDGPELLRGLLRDTMQYIMTDEFDDALPAEKDTFEEEEVDPSFGISEEYEVRKSNVCVLLKPQIVLRSLADEKSTVILTAIRTRIHNYSVKDPRVEEDSVNERVMYRNYASIDGLQAFHPSKTCSYLQKAKERFGFLHVPLETLIDLKYETRDFERIAPRTNAQMHYDKFNRLRLHDSHRPLVAETDSQDLAVDHLRHRMDLIRLRCPRFAVLANSEHFGASYNIVTDLLLYRDPAYREHAKKLDVMMFSHDFSDLDSLASVVQALQVRIRHAKALHVQYQLHFQHLNEQGRYDLLALKGEIKDMVDELGLILEAIKTTDDQSGGSDKDKKSALRVEAQANDITWNMMGHEEGELLAKLTIKGASFTWLNKADNSAAITLSVMDLNAVNVAPNAVFTEIISKYNKVEDHPMRQKGMLLNAIWSVLAPVGGIAIIDYLEIALHPLQLQLEKKVGKQLEEYLFGSKREREKKDREQREVEEAMQEEVHGKTSKGSALKRLTNAMKGRDASKEQSAREQQESNSSNFVDQKQAPRRSLALKRSSKSLSTKSSQSDIRSTHRSNTTLNIEDAHSGDSDSDETGQQAIVARQALEMRNRANRNTTFVNAKVYETIFCLSYKGDKQKSITDLYDLEFRSPRLEYRNRTWANADLANHLKKDILKAAWNQKATLLKGVMHHRRPKRQAVADNIRAIRDVQLNRLGSGSFSLPSPSASSDNANKIKELEQEVRKENIDDFYQNEGSSSGSNGNGLAVHPAFRLNIESPDHTVDASNYSEEVDGSKDGQLNGSIDLAGSENDQQGAAGPKSFGKLIVKRLGDATKKRQSSSTATAKRSKRVSSIHREGSSSDDSDSRDESSNDEDDDDDDDDDDDVNIRNEKSGEHDQQKNESIEQTVDSSNLESGTSLDSPHSGRSMRSAITSRFATSNSPSPTNTSPNTDQSQRRGSGIFSNLSPSFAKISASKLGHRKDSGEATPPRSISPMANNGRSSPLLNSRTDRSEKERERERERGVIDSQFTHV